MTSTTWTTAKFLTSKFVDRAQIRAVGQLHSAPNCTNQSHDDDVVLHLRRQIIHLRPSVRNRHPLSTVVLGPPPPESDDAAPRRCSYCAPRLVTFEILRHRLVPKNVPLGQSGIVLLLLNSSLHILDHICLFRTSRHFSQKQQGRETLCTSGGGS